MNHFANMQELMSHLHSGGAITNMDDSCKDCWISFYKGNLCYPNMDKPVTDLGNPQNYRPVPTQWLTENIHRNTPKIKEE